MEYNQIVCCDAIDGLRAMPSGCAKLVVADPPYNIKKATWDNIDSRAKSYILAEILLQENAKKRRC